MIPLAVSAYSATCATGAGVDSLRASLVNRKSGLSPCSFWATPGLDTWVGQTPGVDEFALDARLERYNCRNHRLAGLGLMQDGFSEAIYIAKEKYGPSRVAVIMGSSTSGILETELAYRKRPDDKGDLPEQFTKNFRYTHSFYALTDFVGAMFGLTGPSMAISTACSSSAKAFATAARYIEAGFCDAAVVGGVDSLCQTTLRGFASLELTSKKPCKPFDENRNGLSIGEAAAFAILERADDATSSKATFKGYGESSDAYHMSSPHPEGEGAIKSMAAALKTGGVAPEMVDYINMHGTATLANDLAESKAVKALFPNDPPGSSTKGWTGHTLGAAGALEVVISLIAMEEGFIPGCLNSEKIGADIEANIQLENESRRIKIVMSNSFGFGGNNCSLLFESVS